MYITALIGMVYCMPCLVDNLCVVVETNSLMLYPSQCFDDSPSAVLIQIKCACDYYC